MKTEYSLGIFLLCLVIAMFAGSWALMTYFPAPETPILIGYGCEGSTGPLYANEEDHFPRCQRIEAN